MKMNGNTIILKVMERTQVDLHPDKKDLPDLHQEQHQDKVSHKLLIQDQNLLQRLHLDQHPKMKMCPNQILVMMTGIMMNGEILKSGNIIMRMRQISQVPQCAADQSPEQLHESSPELHQDRRP